MQPMIPKTIVALGESTDVVETGSGIDVGYGSVDSDLKDRKWLLRIRFDITIDGSQAVAKSKSDTMMGKDPASEYIKKATESCYLN
jgi:hypothetical protein